MNPLLLSYTLSLCFYFNLAASRVVLSLYALDLGARPLDVGGLISLYYMFPVLLSWPVGKFADRVGARWPLLVAAGCCILGMLLPYLLHSMAALYIASALCGLALALYNVVLQTLVGVLSRPEGRAQAFGNLSLIGSTVNFIGPVAAGAMIDYAGGAPVASLAMVMPALLATLLIARHGALLPQGSTSAAPARHLLDSVRDRGVLRTLATGALVQLGQDIYQFYLPIYGHAAGLSATAIGMVVAAFPLAAFCSRLAMPLLLARLSEIRLLVLGFMAAAIGFTLIPFSHDAYALVAIGALFGLGMGCAAPLSMMLTFSYSAPGRSGEAMGLRLTANNIVRVLAPALFGTIGSMFGAWPVFLLSAVTMGAGGMLCRGLRGARSD